jgi:hypothetical protein
MKQKTKILTFAVARRDWNEDVSDASVDIVTSVMTIFQRFGQSDVGQKCRSTHCKQICLKLTRHNKK